MKILGIDTSSRYLNIALSEDKDIIKEEAYLLDRKHASQLVPKIMELLKKSKVPINKIDAFIIGLGPGSFTGLRIGVSAIKGFGIATGKPCIGVASIDAIACNAEGEDRDIIPIIDAKRGQVYAAIYRRKAGRVVRLSDYMVLPVEKLMRKVKRDSVFLGDGVSLYRDKIASKSKCQLAFLLEKYWYPGAGNIIKLGFSRMEPTRAQARGTLGGILSPPLVSVAGECIKKAKKPGLDKLTPLYLYPDDCQVRKP